MTDRHRLPAASILALALLATPAIVSAQTYIRADCRDTVSQPPLKFDDPAHELAYNRFWSGDCGAESFCASGAFWNSVVTQLLAQSEAADRPAVKLRACQLGRLIGYEWARANSIRKIDANQVSDFVKTLQAAPKPSDGLTTVEAQARAALAR